MTSSWSRYQDQSAAQIAGQFGKPFADALLALPTGAWQGPVESGYGWHLVRVESRSEARPADYEQARAEVRAAWLEQVRSEADDVLYERLREGYEVEIDAAMREIAGALQ